MLFLGADVVNWLFTNVAGFTDRREARKYASQMLKVTKHTKYYLLCISIHYIEVTLNTTIHFIHYKEHYTERILHVLLYMWKGHY